MEYMAYVLILVRVFICFVCLLPIWGPDERWGARASSVDANLTRRIDPYCPEDLESPNRMILTTFDFHFGSLAVLGHPSWGLLGPHLPHTPGVRMTVVTQTP